MEIQSLDISHAMQLAVLDQKLMFEEGNETDKSLVQLDIRMKSWLSEEYQAIGVLDSGLVTAFCLFKPLEDAMFIAKLYVIEGERRKGIATRLIGDVKGIAPLKPIRLHVAPKNKAAKKFYKSIGFHEVYRTFELG